MVFDESTSLYKHEPTPLKLIGVDFEINSKGDNKLRHTLKESPISTSMVVVRECGEKVTI